jgi:transmembrane sensor
MTEPEQNALEREAHEWVMRLTSGEATNADIEALNRWRKTSRAHRRAFAEANALWDKLHPAAAISVTRQGTTSVLQDARRYSSSLAFGRRAFLGGAIAAAAVGYAVVYPPLRLWPSLAEMAADFRTGTGQQRRIAFAGSASVQLNTQTSIAVLSRQPTESAVQRIELISGEAAITTGAQDIEPFIVVAERGRTVATNAHFNIRNDGAAVCVSCLQGSVEVQHLGQVATVPANQQITYTANGLSAATTVDSDVVTAWQRGLLVFRDDPLSRVIEEVNRYRPGKIILMNRDIGRRSVLATFRVDRIDEVVPRLQAVFGLRVRNLPGGIVLLS